MGALLQLDSHNYELATGGQREKVTNGHFYSQLVLSLENVRLPKLDSIQFAVILYILWLTDKQPFSQRNALL